MAQGWLNAPEGGVSSPGAARDDLGAPRIVTGAEAADAMGRLGYNVDNMTSMLPTMNKIVQSTTSLIDNAYDRQIAYRKSLADLGESAAKTSLYGAQADNIQTEADLHKQTMDLDVQQKKVGLQRDQLALQAAQIGIGDAQHQQQIANDAYSEYPAYRDAMTALTPEDPNLDDDIAAIKRKYQNASSFAATEGRVAGLEADLYNRRKNSTTVQYNAALMGGLEQAQQSNLLPSRVDVRKEVLNGNGDMLLQDASRAVVNKRLDAVAGAIAASQQPGAPLDRQTVNDLRVGINNPTPEHGAVFGHDGSLNTEDNTQISQLEAKYGVKSAYPDVKMTVTQEPDEHGVMRNKYQLTGPPGQVKAAEAAVGPAGPGAQFNYDYSKDQDYRQATQDVNSTPGDYSTPQKLTQAIWNRYLAIRQSKGLGAPGSDQTNQTAQPQKTGVGGRPVPPNYRGTPLSQAEPIQPDTSGSRRLNAIYNNPGALGLSDLGRRFGATASGKYDTGHPFAQFPTKEAGAAAQFALWENKEHYLGHTLKDAITNWIGPGEHGEAEYISQRTGIPLDQTITDDFLRSPDGIRLMQAQAEYEGQNVLTAEQWKRGQDWAYKGIEPGSGAKRESEVAQRGSQQPAGPATAAAAPAARAPAQPSATRLTALTPLQYTPTEREGEVAQYLPRRGAAA